MGPGLEQQFFETYPFMDRVRLQLRPVAGRATGQIVVEVWDIFEVGPGDWRDRKLFRFVRPATQVTGPQVFEVRFPGSAIYRYRNWRIRVSNPTAQPGSGVQALVSLDDAMPDSALYVNGREQWGDLVFETRSARGTVWRDAAAYLREGLSSRFPVQPALGLLLLLVNVALIGLAWHVIFEGWSMPRPAAAGASATLSRGSDPTRFRVPPALAWTVMAALVAVSAVTMPDIDWGSGPAPGTIDLLERFPEAGKDPGGRRLHDAFRLERVDIDGVARRVLFAHPPSKVTWRLRLPTPARLETAFAIRPDAWQLRGDGVVFRIEVWEGGRSRTLVEQWVDPYDRPADRRWFPVSVDVSPWGGRDIDIVFTTEAGFNAVHDAAVWGEPVILPR